MKGQYSAQWRKTIIASVILHALIFLGLMGAMSLSREDQQVASSELEWIDVDWVEMSADGLAIEAPAIDQTTAATEDADEVYSRFGFMPLVIPDIPFPDISLPDWTPPPIEHQTFTPPPTVEQPPKIEQQPPPQLPFGSAPLGREEKTVEDKPTENRRMSEPPVVIEEHYPPRSGTFHYDGSVSILIRIGEDGLVKQAQVMYSSDRMLVDGAAMAAARKWKFSPALDQDGRPMECDKILTFNFKDLS